jgi:hypothetical protein
MYRKYKLGAVGTGTKGLSLAANYVQKLQIGCSRQGYQGAHCCFKLCTENTNWVQKAGIPRDSVLPQIMYRKYKLGAVGKGTKGLSVASNYVQKIQVGCSRQGYQGAQSCPKLCTENTNYFKLSHHFDIHRIQHTTQRVATQLNHADVSFRWCRTHRGTT